MERFMNLKTALATLICFFQLQANEVSIQEFFPSNPFFIPKEQVESLLQKTGLGIDELLIRLIPIAKSYARPPISEYMVGTAALGNSGSVYLGVNLEFAGLPLNNAVHGEQFLIANARNHGETGIAKLAISAAPCGHCRQFLHEFDCEEQLEVLIPNHPPEKLSFFLPKAFGPRDLGLMESPWNRYSEEGGKPFAIALAAAQNSHAPYSKSKAGIAIQTADGSVYAGSYMENAAFNPSLSPLHAALVALVSDLRSYDEIIRVVLVEAEGAKISQEASTRELLSRIAPQAEFHIDQSKALLP